MKKKIMVIIAMICVAIITILPFQITNKEEKVYASSNKNLELKDEFKGDAFSNEWTSNGASFITDYYGLAVSKCLNWGSTINLLNYRLDSDHDYKINLEMSSQNVGYFGVAFGIDVSTTAFSYARSALILDANSSRVMLRADGTNLLNQYTMSQNNTYSSVFGEVGIKNNIQIEIKSDRSVSIYSSIGNDELQFLGKWENVFYEGYLSFSGWNNASFEIYNFSILKDNGIYYTDDFTTSKMTYSRTNIKGFDWFTTISSDICVLGAFNHVKLLANTSLKPNYKIEDNKSSEIQFEISLKVKLNSLANDEYFGLNFGEKQLNQMSSFIGLSKNEGTYNLVYAKSGEAVDIKKSFSVQEVENGEYNTIKIVGKYGKKVQVEFLSNTYEFEDVDYNGYFSISDFAYGDSSNSQINFDDFLYYKYVSKHHTSEDLSINFKGIKEVTIQGTNLTKKEYYVNKYKFYKNNVTIPLYRSGESSYGCVRFVNATSNPVYPIFAPRYEYSEFILRFKLKVATVVNADINGFARIGVSIGMPSVYSTPVEYPSFFFQLNKESDEVHQTFLVGLNMTMVDTDRIDNAKPSEINVWENKDYVYDVMLIAENGRLRVFFKNETDPETDMSIVRAEFTNVNTCGYVGITGYNGSSFEILQMSITNINPYM